MLVGMRGCLTLLALLLAACTPTSRGRPCERDGECPAGDSCVDGACTFTGRYPVPPVTVRDAGPEQATDAGAADADAGDAGDKTDAGPLDAGRDAGDVDAGATDAGIDAGGDAGFVSPVQVTVPATANVFRAGHIGAADTTSPGTLPPAVALAGAMTLTSSSTGTILYAPLFEPNGADGRVGTPIGESPDVDGLAGPSNVGRGRALLGVFLDDTVPQAPAPAKITLSDPAYLGVAPALRQIFFVGDGLTGTDAGEVQSVTVPIGATRILFGFFDGSSWQGPPASYADNSGSLDVTVTLR